MTATAPSVGTSAPGRAGALALAAALLLAVSGLFAIPEDFFTQAYHTASWTVLAAAAPVLTVTTLVLTAAAVARGSRTFLLVVGVGAALHLVALVWLGLLAADGGPTADADGLLPSGPAPLLLALACLALAWWITSRTDRRPWVPLVLVALAPLLGRITGSSSAWDLVWWAALVVTMDLPAVLTILAAGLVCLPDRGPRITGAALIVLAAVGVYVSDFLLGHEPHPYQLTTMGLAFVCAVAAVVARPGPDARPTTASDAANDAEVVTTSDTAVVVVVPPSHSEAAGESEEREAAPADAPGRPRALTLAALAALVLTVALAVPRMFAHGPGIQPAGAGLVPLIGLLVGASVPAVFTLTAGAATLRSRGALLTATVCSGLLGIALLVSRTAVGGTITFQEGLTFVTLGLSLALAWTGVLRPGAHSTTLHWAAAVPLVLAALPLDVSVVPVLAAALLGFPHRGTRTATGVLLGVLAIGAVGTVLEDAAGLRRLTALNLLQVGGYALACVLVVSATLAPKTGRKPQRSRPQRRGVS